MKIKELMDIMSCKDGRELFYKVEQTLGEFGIDIYNDDGTVKACMRYAVKLQKF